MIHNVDDIVKWIKNLENEPNIETALEEVSGKYLLTSSSASFINAIHNTQLENALREIEVAASFYFYTETGEPIKAAVQKLINRQIQVIKLGHEMTPFTHGLKTEKFIIPFSL